MPKQEEIRKGIANRLVHWKDAICRMVETDKNPNVDSPMTIARLILQDLVDAGVVIKVDRGGISPESTTSSNPTTFMSGYVAVEPLIEEATVAKSE